MGQRIERRPALIDQHAQREQCRAADPVLAMDQHLLSAGKVIAHERYTPFEMFVACRFQVWRRQMKEVDACAAQRKLVVAFLGAEIDDGAYAVGLRQDGGTLRRKAAAERQTIGQPVEIMGRTEHHRSIFFFNIHCIFFFDIRSQLIFTVVSCRLLQSLQSRMEQQSFTTVPNNRDDSFQCRTDPRMNVIEPRLRAIPRNDLEERIDALAPWFHNINLGGVWTAPDHFLGDYPGAKFRRFAPHLPKDLAGKSVLDIGCNAGFYSIEMKRRGAGRVLGIDSDERYLAQARLASATLGLGDIEFANVDVYEVGALGEKFDLVIFMGVLYHLRHPLLALDLIREHVADHMLLFQSMQRGSKHALKLDRDYEFTETSMFFESSFPKLHFIEHQYAHDWTNWWVPNRACTEAMLRSAGFSIDRQIEEEVYLCSVAERPYAKYGPAAVYPPKGTAE